MHLRPTLLPNSWKGLVLQLQREIDFRFSGQMVALHVNLCLIQAITYMLPASVGLET